MRAEPIEPDIWLFHGDAYESVATAFVDGDRVLLVDTLASSVDAVWMRRHIESELGARVCQIVMTHYMSDHMGGLREFPGARIIAHRDHMHTFLSQRSRSMEDDACFAPPDITFTGALSFRWGAHALHAFHNPGKTMSDIAIDVPDCDLVLCGDAIVGNIAYLSLSSPEALDTALLRLQRLHRHRIVPGHIGLFDDNALDHAHHYLTRLRELAVMAHCDGEEAVSRLRIEDCLPAGVCVSEFEREWHRRNLDVILERRVFAVDSGRQSRYPAETAAINT